MLADANNCNICPRRCNVDRYSKAGYCGVKNDVIIARAALHEWEEPCLSAKNGAGTIFFSGCNLHCRYCQNNSISNKLHGKAISVRQLADIILSLQSQGADNIEFVTPTHYILQVIKALDIAKPFLNIPVIYNTGGYELTETIKLLDGYIDIYLPDLKYFSSEAAARYSNAPDYFEYASSAILEMLKQTSEIKYNSSGALVKGTVIRHLVLPSLRHDSIKIIDWIADNIPLENVLVSIMNQYTPFDFIPDKYAEIKRKVTKMEYNSVVNHAIDRGINGFTQQKSSACSDYVPDFEF